MLAVFNSCYRPNPKGSFLLRRFNFDYPIPLCKSFKVYQVFTPYLSFISCARFSFDVILTLIFDPDYEWFNFGWLANTCPPILESILNGYVLVWSARCKTIYLFIFYAACFQRAFESTTSSFRGRRMFSIVLGIDFASLLSLQRAETLFDVLGLLKENCIDSSQV